MVRDGGERYRSQEIIHYPSYQVWSQIHNSNSKCYSIHWKEKCLIVCDSYPRTVMTRQYWSDMYNSLDSKTVSWNSLYPRPASPYFDRYLTCFAVLFWYCFDVLHRLISSHTFFSVETMYVTALTNRYQGKYLQWMSTQ